MDANFGGVAPPDDQLVRLEAVFFLSQQPQTSRKLAQLAGLADGTKARTLVRTLNRRYDAEGSAFRVEEVAGGFQLMTRSKFAPWLRRLHSAPAEVRLSAPAMETLAVVAYRQPVLRAEIEAIRGVQSGEVLRQLIERDSGADRRPFRRVGPAIPLRNHQAVPASFRTTAPGRASPGRRLANLPVIGYTSNNPNHDVQIGADADSPNPSHQSPVAEEETNVNTLITTEPRQNTLAEEDCPTVTRPRHNDRPGTPEFDIMTKRKKRGRTDDEEDFEDEDEEDDEDEEEDDETSMTSRGKKWTMTTKT